jgi:hypothetical protein
VVSTSLVSMRGHAWGKVTVETHDGRPGASLESFSPRVDALDNHVTGDEHTQQR